MLIANCCLRTDVPLYVPRSDAKLGTLLLEHIAGGTLQKHLDDAAEHRLPLRDTLRMATQILAALETIHEKKCIHRDVKPTNIMACADGGADVWKLIGVLTSRKSLCLRQHTVSLKKQFNAKYIYCVASLTSMPSPRPCADFGLAFAERDADIATAMKADTNDMVAEKGTLPPIPPPSVCRLYIVKTRLRESHESVLCCRNLVVHEPRDF